MNLEIESKIEEVKSHIGEIENINKAIGLLYWDMKTYMPKKSLDSKSGVLEYLSELEFKLTTGDKVGEFINFFEDKMNELELVNRVMIETLKRNYDETKKIPKEKYLEYVGVSAKSEAAWEEAKKKCDFNIFKPHLEKVVKYKKEFIEYWGYKDNKYDTLLDKYERGITVEKLDIIFGELRDGIVELLNKIKGSNKKISKDILSGNFPVKAQEKLSIEVLTKMGFDFDAGRLDVSVHPFTLDMGNKDVRLTTHYYEKEISSALLSSIHEGGHGIYEQGVSDLLEGTGLAGGVSMGIHESQSRFYENLIGRSKEFWTYFLPVVKENFESFKDTSLDEFYEAINYVEPSLIRIEADELTYSLHIIIRYEIEKSLINGEIEVCDLPRVWNEKYKEYLGIEPENDGEGVLQDMHWSDGSFGYFPSYALGNIYGAQMLNKLLQERPDTFKEVSEGNLGGIHEWLKENVHKHGCIYSPAELIQNITGEEINTKYFLEYLNNKYLSIYTDIL
ncbi:MAG: carboxypeptidase M32 [Clostridium sp.]